MRIKYKKKYEKNNFTDISSILNDKPDYLRNLEKKRNEGINKIQEQKARLIIDDILKLNKFKRNYSCFSNYYGIDKSIKPISIDIVQLSKRPNQQRLIESYSKKQMINKRIDNVILFSNEYIQKKSLEKRQINNYNYSNNNRHKLLMNIGKQVIVEKKNVNNENGKTYRNIGIQI